MRKPIAAMMIAAVCNLTACATIIDGKSQQISVSTSIDGADCNMQRKGELIARLPPTPSAATIEKTRHDIEITCSKAGYSDGTYLNESGTDGWVFGNLVLGGLVGLVIDLSTGADNKYDSKVNVVMTPLLPETQPAVSANTTTIVQPPMAPEAMAASTLSTGQSLRLTADRQLRGQPKSTGTPLAVLPAGTTVTLDGQVGDFWFVKSSIAVGWLATDELK